MEYRNLYNHDYLLWKIFFLITSTCLNISQSCPYPSPEWRLPKASFKEDPYKEDPEALQSYLYCRLYKESP